MGQYYAKLDGLPNSVAIAIREHYSPLGPTDTVPTAPVSIALAMAEKIDTLAGFFAIGEKVTGSKDPFALRRAALGIIRIILENKLRLNLHGLFMQAIRLYEPVAQNLLSTIVTSDPTVNNKLMDFVIERLKVFLREKGISHDLISAVFTKSTTHDLTLAVKQLDALSKFLTTEDGVNLLAGYRRAANILRIEEKRDGTGYRQSVDILLLTETSEFELYSALESQTPILKSHILTENYDGAMQALAQLRAPIDAFFEQVTVNVDDPTIRRNRLAILGSIQTAMSYVADFSVIEGRVSSVN